MAHTHTVTDDDKRFVIDVDSRAITHDSETQPMLIQHDHNSERFTFEVPKTIDGHDVTLCNLVRVHFINISGSNVNEHSASIYEATDIAADADDSDKVVFSWLIAQEATEYVGTLDFLVEFACISDDNKIEYSWHTSIYTGVIISTGMDNSEVIIGDRYDVLDTWAALFESRLEQKGTEVNASVAAAEKKAQSDFNNYVESIKDDIAVDILSTRGILTQARGNSPDKIMSQKVVTDELSKLDSEIAQLATKNTYPADAVEFFLGGSPESLMGYYKIQGAAVSVTIIGVSYPFSIQLPLPLGLLPENIKPMEAIEYCIGKHDESGEGSFAGYVVWLNIDTDGNVRITYSTPNQSEFNALTPISFPKTLNFIGLSDKFVDNPIPAELINARVGGDGTVYESAGDAIRGQVAKLKGETETDIIESENSIKSYADKADTILGSRISKNDKRITNLEQGITPDPFETDSEVAMVKTVPTNALPYAEVTKVGGMSYRSINIWNERWENGSYDNTTGEPINGSNIRSKTDEYIRVEPSTSYYFYCGVVAEIIVFFYDSQKQFLSVSSATNGKTFTTVENTAYLRFRMSYDYGSTYNNDICINKSDPAINGKYYPYWSGLHDAKVTDIRACESNLFDIDNPVTGANSENNLNTGPVKIEKGTISFAAVSGMTGGAGLLFEVSPGAVVDISWDAVSGSGAVGVQAGKSVIGSIIQDTVYVTPQSLSATHYTFTQPANMNWFVFMIAGSVKAYDVVVKNLRITATGASGKVINTLSIPVEVLEDDGIHELYGQGVNADYNNHIEFTEDGRVIFRKEVKKITLTGAEGWNIWTHPTTGQQFFQVVVSGSPTMSGGVGTCYSVCDTFVESTTTNMSAGQYYARSSYGGYGAMLFCYTPITTLVDWKAYLADNPITIVYSLDPSRAEEIDITHLFMNLDNFIKVEGGGTVTFVNEHGLNVQSEVSYMLKGVTE